MSVEKFGLTVTVLLMSYQPPAHSHKMYRLQLSDFLQARNCQHQQQIHRVVALKVPVFIDLLFLLTAHEQNVKAVMMSTTKLIPKPKASASVDGRDDPPDAEGKPVGVLEACPVCVEV